MKKIVIMILALALVLAGCQSGVSPSAVQPQADKNQEVASESEKQANDESKQEAKEVDSTVSDEEGSESNDGEGEPTKVAESDSVDEEGTKGEIDEVSEALEENTVSTELDESDSVTEEEESSEGQDTQELPVISKPITSAKALQTDEVKAIWFSYLDLRTMFASGTEAGYRQEITTAMENVAGLGLNTVMYQVRPFGDAIYESQLFPSSHIISGVEGEDIGFDPFEIAVEVAHSKGLRIEAWINPYRVRNSTTDVDLDPEGIAAKWYYDGTRRVLRTSDGTMVFNPAEEEVQNYIIAGVKEVLDNYSVDGIHFDDYFYPTTEISFDEEDYLYYQYDAPPMTLEEFRMYNVNLLVKQVYTLVHSYDRDLIFGISPQGSIQTNIERLYVDIPLWLSEPGYVDYVCPQIYYGFEHERLPYSQTLDQWDQLILNDVQLIAGLAAYKIGLEDQWAGEGISEWVETEQIMAKMIEASRKTNNYSGYAIFRYDFLFKAVDGFEEIIEEERLGIEMTH